MFSARTGRCERSCSLLRRHELTYQRRNFSCCRRSPDALQALGLGYKKHLSGDVPGALAYYKRAIDTDPYFALAFAAESSANSQLYNDVLALIGSAKAFALRNRLTIPSRFQVESLYYGGRIEWDQACRVEQEWVQAFRRDVIARINFCSCLENLGRHDEQLVQAREAATRFGMELIRGVLAGGLSLGLVTAPPEDSQITTVPFARASLYAAVPEDHPSVPQGPVVIPRPPTGPMDSLRQASPPCDPRRDP